MNEKQIIKLVNKLEQLIQQGNLEEIKKIDNIQSLDPESYNDIFRDACASISTEVVKYLYEVKKPGQYGLQDGFRCCLDTDNFDTIKFLISDLKIHKTYDIQDDINEYLNELKGWNQDFYNQIIPLFQETKKSKLSKK